MAKFLPIVVTINDEKEKTVRVQNTDGRVWIRIGTKKGGVDVCIAQSDDGLGLAIDAWDAKTCEQHLGTMAVWFDDIENEEKDETN